MKWLSHCLPLGGCLLQGLCMVVVMIGTSLSASFGSHHSGHHDVAGLEALASAWYIAPYCYGMLANVVLSCIILECGSCERPCTTGSGGHAQLICHTSPGCIVGTFSTPHYCTQIWQGVLAAI
jgi:hypothetical protein